MTDPAYEATLLDFGYFTAYVQWCEENGKEDSREGYFAFLNNDSQRPWVRKRVDKAIAWARAERPPGHPDFVDWLPYPPEDSEAS